MNPIELFHEDGKSAGVYYCSKCKKITDKGNFQIIENCCKPYMCKYCSILVDSEIEGKYRTAHRVCQEKADYDKEQDIINKAEKLEDWEGYLWYDERVFVSMEDLTDYMDCQFSEEEDWPEFVFVAIPLEQRKMNSGHIVDDFLEDSYETAYIYIDPDSVKNLQIAIDKFYQDHAHIICYIEDISRVVRIPKNKEDEADNFVFIENKEYS